LISIVLCEKSSERTQVVEWIVRVHIEKRRYGGTEEEVIRSTATKLRVVHGRKLVEVGGCVKEGIEVVEVTFMSGLCQRIGLGGESNCDAHFAKILQSSYTLAACIMYVVQESGRNEAGLRSLSCV
jgi:hypothetical protein